MINESLESRLFWISWRKNTIIWLISDIQLQALNLSNRDIEQIEEGAFCCLENLSHFELGQNNLTVMPELCSLKIFADNVTTAEQQNRNAREHYFRYFLKWKFLLISFNKFQGLGSVMWLDLQLTILDASTNEISHLDEMFLGKSRSIYLMEEFHAAGNEITYFKTSSYFSHMAWLKYLDLRKNKLAHMRNFGALYLERIRLYGNPWDCGRQLSWMIWLNHSDVAELKFETPSCQRGNVDLWTTLATE